MDLASPWLKYQRIYDIRLGNDYRVTVAEEMDSPHREVSIRLFPGAENEHHLQMLQRIRHINFVSVFETFRFEATTYVVFENMRLSLCEIARSPLPVNTIGLAALLGQVWFSSSPQARR
jgi:hypothetical protein